MTIRRLVNGLKSGQALLDAPSHRLWRGRHRRLGLLTASKKSLLCSHHPQPHASAFEAS